MVNLMLMKKSIRKGGANDSVPSDGRFNILDILNYLQYFY